jgi:hypothetical protein
LGSLGEIYINDAPLASLTNSNTVSEIKCSKKVMGMKMTEELRNIAQFFLKDFTLDVDPTVYNIQHNSNKEYLTYKSAAIIGGISTSKTDILEKILLANSFLDSFEQIYLVGEIGLAAICSLGINPGHVERSEDNIKEYESMKELFIKLFSKSVEANCKIVLPVDFVCAPKNNLQAIIDANSGKPSAADAAASPDKTGTGSAADPSKSALPIGEVSEMQQVNSGFDELSRIASVKYDAHFKPAHWADAQIFYGASKIIDLEALVNKKFEAVVADATRAYLIK